MQICLYMAEDRERWDEYVKKSNTSSFYHYSGWKNVIEKSFRHETYYLLSEDDEKNVRGILPLVHIKSLLFGNFLVSLPYFDNGGICADHIDIHHQILQEAIRIAMMEKAEYIELRDTRLLNNGLPVKTAKVSMRLELPTTYDKLWRSFPSKLRSQIRKPQKEGIYVRVSREDELDSFYRVFSINMRDLGTPVYSKAFFKNILEEFPESTWICSIYKEKEPIASGFLLGFKKSLEIPWASSLRKYNHYSPNMLLYWTSLKFACERGYRVFDFGRSTPEKGTYRFKEQWGAKPVQLYWYYWMRNEGPLPELNPENPKYRIAINAWKKLPISLTRLIGPSIVKNLP